MLSFGQQRFLNLKIVLCPELDKLTYYITLLAKSGFIKYYMPVERGLLVDNRLGQGLSKGWVEVHIDRNSQNSKARIIKRDLYEISSLGQLSWVLTN